MSSIAVTSQVSVRTSMCPLDCPDGCSLDVRVSAGRVVGVDGNRLNPTTQGFICGKVRRYPDHVYHALRVRRPLVRASGPKGDASGFRETGWDEALELIAERMREARARHGGEAILPFSYGGSNGKLTQDSSDLALFRRLGASRLLQTVCAAPTTAARKGLYGAMPGVAYTDFVHSKLIVVWGTNPSASGIHLVPYIKEAQERGARLVVVDPRRIKLARSADRHLAPRPGTDVALALAVIRWLFENSRADAAFLAEHTEGSATLRERALEWTLERASTVTGIPGAEIERFAELYAESSPALIRCGWGLERNRNGGSAAAAVLALPAVAGKFGVRGGGYTLSNSGSHAYRAPFDDPEPPTREINMNRIGRALLELADPPIEVLFVYNANPLMTVPDQERVRRGLEREGLFTVVFDQVLTDTARYADIVLPATTFLEHHELRSGYGSYGEQSSAPVIEPVGEARPNYQVFTELLERLELARPEDPRTPEELTRAMLGDDERFDALRRGEILPPDFGTQPVQLVDIFPGTADGRIHLVPEDLDREAPEGLYAFLPERVDERHPLALISPATEKTISSSLGQLVRGKARVGLHPEDARARGLADGDPVRVFNDLGEVHVALHVDPHLRPGVCELSKGLWATHTENGLTATALVPDGLTDVGRGACFNDARVEVARR